MELFLNDKWLNCVQSKRGKSIRNCILWLRLIFFRNSQVTARQKTRGFC